MKKISAREFQRRFGQIIQALSPGESIEITSRGKSIGVFTKRPHRSVKTPDFLANLQATGGDPRLGDKLLEEFNAGLFVQSGGFRQG